MNDGIRHRIRHRTLFNCSCKPMHIVDAFLNDQTTRGMVDQVKGDTTTLRVRVIHIHQSRDTTACEAAVQLHILAPHRTSLPIRLLSYREFNNNSMATSTGIVNEHVN